MVPFSYPVVTLHLVHNPLQVDCPKTHDMKHELSNSPITFGKTGHHQGLFNVAIKKVLQAFIIFFIASTLGRHVWPKLAPATVHIWTQSSVGQSRSVIPKSFPEMTTLPQGKPLFFASNIVDMSTNDLSAIPQLQHFGRLSTSDPRGRFLKLARDCAPQRGPATVWIKASTDLKLKN